MNEDRLRGLLGLCVRARQAVFGQDGCLKSIRNGQCGVLLLDSGASAATADKYTTTCESHGTPLIRIPEGLLKDATGRPGVAMAVVPGGLCDQLKRLAADGNPEHNEH